MSKEKDINARKPLYEAMAASQHEYAGRLVGDKMGNYGEYPTLGGLYTLVRSILLKNGLLLHHYGEIDFASGKEIEVTELIHVATGERVIDKRFNISEKPGNQGRGTSSTYMKRYGVKALLAIDVGEDDDDGQDEADYIEFLKQKKKNESQSTPDPKKIVKEPKATAYHIRKLRELIDKTSAPSKYLHNILQYNQVTVLEDLGEQQCEKATARMQQILSAK